MRIRARVVARLLRVPILRIEADVRVSDDDLPASPRASLADAEALVADVHAALAARPARNGSGPVSVRR